MRLENLEEGEKRKRERKKNNNLKKMKTNVFYSWQSDLEGKYNRNFISDCIETSVRELGKEKFNVEFNTDRDTKDETGSPDIADTILRKIQESHIFVADISIINPEDERYRKVQNPNVMLELGFAVKELGWENIILVFNEAYGNVSKLPFDIRNRRPLIYKLNPSVDKAQIKKKVVNLLKDNFKSQEIDSVFKRREIERQYSRSTPRAKYYAIKQPPYWEFFLMSELLKSTSDRLSFEYLLVKDRIIYQWQNRKTVMEMLDWFSELNDNNIKHIEAVGFILNERTTKSFGEPGKPGDAIEIKRIADTYEQIGKASLEMEKILLSHTLNIELENMRNLYLGCTEHFIKFLTQLSNDLFNIKNRAETNMDEKQIRLSYEFEPYLDTDKIVLEHKRVVDLIKQGKLNKDEY